MRACLASVAVVLFGIADIAADEPKPLKPVYPSAKGIAVVVPAKAAPKSPPVEIKTAEELAKSPLFGPGGAEKVKTEVNFDREKLVVFAWSDSVYRWSVTCKLAADGKSATFTWNQTNVKKDAETREHCLIYVVPKDAAMKIEVNPRVPK
jgi:hypothetical protein